jgi:hypothetical protein
MVRRTITVAKLKYNLKALTKAERENYFVGRFSKQIRVIRGFYATLQVCAFCAFLRQRAFV